MKLFHVALLSLGNSFACIASNVDQIYRDPDPDCPNGCPDSFECVESFGCLPSTYRNGKKMIYIHNDREESFDTHEAMANSCGGYLASILNDKEKDLVKSLRKTEVWVGGHQSKDCDDEPSGCWYWLDGSTWSKTYWADGEPNDIFKEDCVQLRDYADKWNDARCSDVQSGAIYILPMEFPTTPNCALFNTYPTAAPQVRPPQCLQRCNTRGSTCKTDKISRFLFAGQSNMEGVPLQASEVLFDKLVEILNAKKMNKKDRLKNMEQYINDAEESRPHSSKNEARFMLRLRKYMKRKRINKNHKNAICSWTKPAEMEDLDCERPVSPTACGNPYGPELMFAHKFPKLKSPLKGKPVGIIKVAQGGTQIYKHWSKESGSYWLNLKDAIVAAKGSIEAFVWFQGENDTFDQWNEDNYLDHLTQFIADVRNEIYISSNKFQSAMEVPVVIVELGAWRYFPPDVRTVVNAQRTFVKNTANTKIVSSGSSDNKTKQLSHFYHFDAASILIIGSRIAHAVASLMQSSQSIVD